MLRGGGVAFGPHPRDFSTKLPRKVYDLAWRTALSYRYRRGQLIIVDDNIGIPRGSSPYLLQEIFATHSWGKKHGRSLLITEIKKERLFKAMAEVGEHGQVLNRADVDVKDLLETGRLIIEKKALDRMLSRHSKDLKTRAPKG
jgi:large subunit ribosomal protein L4